MFASILECRLWSYSQGEGRHVRGGALRFHHHWSPIFTRPARWFACKGRQVTCTINSGASSKIVHFCSEVKVIHFHVGVIIWVWTSLGPLRVMWGMTQIQMQDSFQMFHDVYCTACYLSQQVSPHHNCLTKFGTAVADLAQGICARTLVSNEVSRKTQTDIALSKFQSLLI